MGHVYQILVWWKTWPSPFMLDSDNNYKLMIISIAMYRSPIDIDTPTGFRGHGKLIKMYSSLYNNKQCAFISIMLLFHC